MSNLSIKEELEEIASALLDKKELFSPLL